MPPFNGSGTFTLVSGNPVVTGTTISSTVQNNTTSDFATGFTTCLTKDGQTTPTANLPMGNYKHTGAGAASATGQYLTYGQASASLADLTLSGTLNVTGVVTMVAPSTVLLKDSTSFISDEGDATKKLAFQASGITTGTTRTWTIADKSGTVAMTTDAIAPSVLTTAGDMIYATGASTPARLGIGTALQVLRTNAGATAPEWATISTVTLATPQASTSGTAIDFTGIPSTARVIYVMFDGVSTNGSSPILIQIGDAGGIENSGYISAAFDYSGPAGSTAGFITVTTAVAGNTVNGLMTLTMMNSSANTWTESGCIGGNNIAYSSGGTKSLSQALDRVRITMENGTDAFDAGSINVSYQ